MHRAAFTARGGVWLLAGCLLLASCASRQGRGSPSPRQAAAAAEVDRAEGEALLLLMTDQLLFEPFAIAEIYRSQPRLHEQLAIALGRIGDPRGLPYLESLLEDPAVEVRRAAAFGLGQLGEVRAYPNLLGALGDMDREVGQLAAEALARIELPLDRLESALGVLPEDEAVARLVPALFRFEADEIHGFAERHAERTERTDASPDLDDFRKWLLYALARSGDARGLSRLRSSLTSPDAWIRGWAARAVGRLGDRSDLERLRPLLEAEESGVVVQALRAASALIDAGKAAAPDSWLGSLERLIEDPRAGVRLTALESSGSWHLGASLAARLRALATEGRGRAAELALVALARAGDVDAEQLIARASGSPRDSMRRAAAAAAVIAGIEPMISRLLDDPEPSVRLAALTALLEVLTPNETRFQALGAASTVAREALLDADPGVRTVALEWLALHPMAPLDELVLAMSRTARPRLPALLVAGSAALGARADAEPLERGASIAALEGLAQSAQYVVRRAAGDALAELGRERPPLGPIVSSRTLRDYRSMVQSLEGNRGIELITARGTMRIDLETRTAPLTSTSFLQLARAGFFDGLEFHRVIPDFVAQGGDPRGDGWGGPGFTLRDENSRVAFERGVVGVAKAGPHSGGSQFFLTSSEQPHLNGSYTVLGRVVSGLESLDSIEQGDAIVSIRDIGFLDPG